ncbi:hypothetical protein ACFW0F_21555 [Brucella anthropi]|uniref:hypothetical protein n=1 Tax=Brucella anthropi TaxID=529 RepID=UPI00366CB5F9
MESHSALIGFSGFVGSTIAEQTSFDEIFNSRTIRQAHGKRFGDVVCAAAPGSMFEANRFPEEDGRRIALSPKIGPPGIRIFRLLH